MNKNEIYTPPVVVELGDVCEITNYDVSVTVE